MAKPKNAIGQNTLGVTLAGLKNSVENKNTHSEIKFLSLAHLVA